MGVASKEALEVGVVPDFEMPKQQAPEALERPDRLKNWERRA
jgi:hypothetical protein